MLTMMMMTPDHLKKVLSSWFISEYSLLPNDSLYDSPERSIDRFLIEDQKGDRYLLDQVPSSSVARKWAIAENLERLHQIDPVLPVHPYRRTNQNLFILEDNQTYWMCSPFIVHQELDRLAYWHEEWRGLEMAEFLKRLREASNSLPPNTIRSWDPPLEFYIPDLVRTIQAHYPDRIGQIEPIVLHLQPFLTHYPEFPVAFCHGDFHPLNILWGRNDIVGVIDWEFSGSKPRLYDIANMLGCIGMENPEALAEETAMDFIRYFFDEDFGSPPEWKYLVDLMLSIRFGWMAEWLRRHDAEMIDLEITYMQFLMQYNNELISHWGILKYITGKA